MKRKKWTLNYSGTPYQTNLDKEPVQPISSDYVSFPAIDFGNTLLQSEQIFSFNTVSLIQNLTPTVFTAIEYNIYRQSDSKTSYSFMKSVLFSPQHTVSTS